MWKYLTLHETFIRGALAGDHVGEVVTRMQSEHHVDVAQTQIGVEDHFDIVTPDIDEGTLEDLRTVDDLVRWVADQT